VSGEQIAAFEQWIRMGAAAPRVGPAVPVDGREPYDWKTEKTWWAFQPVKAVPVPAVKDKAWAINDIDRFVQENHEAKGLHPAALADKRTLIRRATYDLTGLPPTPDEVEAFRADDSGGAFEKVVDRLLS